MKAATAMARFDGRDRPVLAAPQGPRRRAPSGDQLELGDQAAGGQHRRRQSPLLARRLLRAKDFVDSHYAEALKVAMIARVAHQSPAHFAREFHRAFGETPHQYLLSRRLERAASLLRNTDYTITRVCNSVGWTSLGSFSTSFRRVYRETPTEYRRRQLPLLAQRVIPPCVLRAVERPQLSRIGEDAA